MKNAFCAFVFGSYDRFIPFYIKAIEKEYPACDILIFYAGKLKKDMISFLKRKENSSIVIYENFYKEKTDTVKDYKIKGGSNKLFRHLIPGKYFTKYNHVYFGDVDILILKEKVNLFNFHKEQVKSTEVPFSNKVRKLPKSNHLSKRLTGLHLVEVEPYYSEMDKLIENFFYNESFRNEIMHGVRRDEEFLYRMNKLAFHFDPQKISKNKRPWHGFHLGLVRGKDYLNVETIKENSSLSLEDLKNQLKRLNENNEINNLLLQFYCKEVYHTYVFLGLPLSKRVHFNYKITIFKDQLYKKLRNLKQDLLPKG